MCLIYYSNAKSNKQTYVSGTHGSRNLLMFLKNKKNYKIFPFTV